MEQLAGKVAVITGGSRGLGRAIALAFAQNGANIAVLDVTPEGAEETCAQCREQGVEARAYCCNVADFAQTKETVAAIKQDFGRVDVLVNNAGIVRDGLILTMSEADYDAVLDVNLKGAFNMIKHVYQMMMRQRSGRIVNIASVVGMMGNAGQANYAAAKAGMIGLTKTVAKELAGRGVTCNAIAPGFIETDMTETLSPEVVANYHAAIPMKRMGKPEDVANVAIFLASEGASYVTGEVIKVDGGLYI